MEQTANATAGTIQKMIDKPQDAWMAALPILFIAIVLGVLFFCYQLWSRSALDSERREVRLTGIIDTSLKEHGQIIAQQTVTLSNVNSSLLDLKIRVEDVEEKVGIKGDS